MEQRGNSGMNISIRERCLSGVLLDKEVVYKDKTTKMLELATGVKDKNGEDIYNGDIIEYDNEKWRVLYDEYNAQFLLKPLSKRLAWYDEQQLTKRYSSKYKRI